MRTIGKHLRCAWLEYEEIQDAIVFTHGATARLGFDNALAALPRGPGGARTRQVRNLPNMSVRVHTYKSGEKKFRAFVARPNDKDAPILEKWVSSPAIESAEFTADPSSTNGLDLLVVSGHGVSGRVWGSGSGASSGLELSGAFSDNVGRPRSGRLKCLIVSSCNNLHEMMAAAWISAFDHPKPVYAILGYRDTYLGGRTGARVMARFVQKLSRNPSMPVVSAWKVANERYRQPWSALVAKGAEGLNLDDWRRGTLPVLSNVADLVYFDGDDPGGHPAMMGNEDHEARWVMEDGTVLDKTNNRIANTKNGLFSGTKGTIRIKALKPTKHFKAGEFAFLGIYYYRITKELDISKVFEFHPDLFKPSPSTGKPIIELEKDLLRGGGGIDALKINLPADSDVIELPFTVRADAASHFDNTGPGGSHGQFILDFGGPDVSNDTIDPDGDRDAWWFSRPEVTAGALLWK